MAWLIWATSEQVISSILSRFDFQQLSGFWGDTVEFLFKTIIMGLTISVYLKIFRYSLLLVLTPSFIRFSHKIQCIELGEMQEYSFKLRYEEHT